MGGIRFSGEEIQFIKENIDNYTYSELAELVSKKFNTHRNRNSISDLCSKRMKIPKSINKGQYREGNIKVQVPIGEIRKSSNGATYIKCLDSEQSHMSGYEEPYWKPLQKKIYENVYGEVPKGKMVIFLDCNRDNFDINNLYCIDRKISAIMASNKWYAKNKENTLTAIKWCELYYALNK